MSESLKTILFAAVGVAAVVIAVVTYPEQEDYQPPQLVNKPLFPDFTDPSNAAKLKIAKFAEDQGQLKEFEVARDSKSGLWSIPSSANYPADAEAQMRDAATSLIDLNVIGIASEENKEHQTFGVIEPNKQKLDASESGVGLLVQFEDAKGKDLASLVIGKRVKGTLSASRASPASASSRSTRASSPPSSTSGSNATCSKLTRWTSIVCNSKTTHSSQLKRWPARAVNWMNVSKHWSPFPRTRTNGS